MSGDLLKRLPIFDDRLSVKSITQLSISGDGRWLLVPVGDGQQIGKVLIWEITREGGSVIEAKPVDSQTDYKSQVVCTDMDVASNRVVSIDESGVIKIWSFLEQKEIVAVEAYSELGNIRRKQFRVCFSSDGKWVLSHNNESDDARVIPAARIGWSGLTHLGDTFGVVAHEKGPRLRSLGGVVKLASAVKVAGEARGIRLLRRNRSRGRRW